MRLSFTENGQVLTGEVITERVHEYTYRNAKSVAVATKDTFTVGKAIGKGLWNAFGDVFTDLTAKKTYTVEELEAMLKELKK